ncbi:tRNA lysidine(34) synthetase TilS [Tessaracoccus sp. Z1128]
MARRELGPAALRVAQAVAAVLPTGPVTVGCSGGADSTALALGAQWAAVRAGATIRVLVVDHGLQAGSRGVADATVARLAAVGIDGAVESVTVPPPHAGGLEAAAREARLAALEAPGAPVLLGHTLDDQAETVLLGLLRGAGTRSLAGMAPVRGRFLRPLLGLRRSDTEQACREWGVDVWHDPMNQDPRFARVAVRGYLRDLSAALGRDVGPALARTATLARADADLLDQLAARAVGERGTLPVNDLDGLPDALRWRAIQRWLGVRSPTAGMVHVMAVAALVDRWHGQGAVTVPGGSVERASGVLVYTPSPRDGAGAAAPAPSR